MLKYMHVRRNMNDRGGGGDANVLWVRRRGCEGFLRIYSSRYVGRYVKIHRHEWLSHACFLCILLLVICVCVWKVKSLEEVLVIDVVFMFLFVGTIELDEMTDSVDFVVEIFRVLKEECVLRGINDTKSDEIVVPETVVRAHEEPFDFIGQEQLDLFIMRVHVALRCLQIFVLLAPFEALLCEFVTSQRARTRCERHRQSYRFFWIPR